jgi:hypothetical protein
VLFVGNSFTARNDLPGLVANIAAADGRRLTHRLLSIGGASLRQHWNKGEATKAIEGGRFDYVVLQEQSTLPVKNATRMAENVRLFDTCIRAAGSRTALYMTWARQHAPETQAAITAAYAGVGNELGTVVIPVGRAWQSFVGTHEQPPLYDRDGSHPTRGSPATGNAYRRSAVRRVGSTSVGRVVGNAPSSRRAVRLPAFAPLTLTVSNWPSASDPHTASSNTAARVRLSIG